MARNRLADALVPPEFARPAAPGARAAPYIAAGAAITCSGGHSIGRLNADIPRYGRPWPAALVLVLDVPMEQRVLVPGAASYGGEADPFFLVDQIAYMVEQFHVAPKPPAWDQILQFHWEAGFDGFCRLCGAPWLVPTFHRDRSVRGFRIHTSAGWDGRSGRIVRSRLPAPAGRRR